MHNHTIPCSDSPVTVAPLALVEELVALPVLLAVEEPLELLPASAPVLVQVTARSRPCRSVAVIIFFPNCEF